MIELLADEIFRKSKTAGIDSLETFLQKKNVKRIEISNGKVNSIIEQERSGTAIRSIINNQLSFVSTNATNQIDNIIELAAQNARKSTQKVYTNFINKKFTTPVKQISDNRLRELSLESICDRVVEILTTIEASKPVQKLDATIIVRTEERLVANTEGIWKKEIGTRLTTDIATTIKMQDFLGVGTSSLATRELYEDWQELFNESIKTALSQRNRKKMSIGKPKGVILSSNAFADILAYAFVPSFNYTSGSYYYESFHNCRFNKDLIMVDDPTYTGAQNTFGFDDEGYPSKPRVVLSGGKCKRLLGMNFSCTEPRETNIYNGNCYRSAYQSQEIRSYTYPPSVSSSNFVIKTKRKATEDIISELDDGIYIKEITGAQDANYFSGDFVIAAVEAYEVKNGEIINPILPCFCTGNIYRILEDPSLIINNTLKENPIIGTPLNLIVPEIITSRMTISI
ncbi:MAG: TldD/PmbA family protein [Asgard group archaeon]|nr:TldD/PmbA family protein [Asgard group archaeon]